MAQAPEELYVDDLLRGLEVPDDLVVLAQRADIMSFETRLRVVHHNLALRNGLVFVEVPTDAGNDQLVVAPTLVDGVEMQRWIFTSPAHDEQDFDIYTTVVKDYFVNPNAEPHERVAKFEWTLPRVRDCRQLDTSAPPHIELGREKTDVLEIFIGSSYDKFVKSIVAEEMGNVDDDAFIDVAEHVPTSCTSTFDGELHIIRI
jgi:hypothetical protein